MRDFLNDILSFILCSTLSDEEWGTIDDLTDQSVTLENYTALLGILDERESVSNARDRLAFYFKAGGVEVPESSAGKTNIFIGGEV